MAALTQLPVSQQTQNNVVSSKKYVKKKYLSDYVTQLIHRLQHAGLIVSQERLTVDGKVLLKIYGSNQRLEQAAELMRYKMKLKHGGYCIFNQSIRDQFVGTNDTTCLFRSSERQQIIEYILKSSIECNGVNIKEFNSYIVQEFPLHMHTRLDELQIWRQYYTIHHHRICGINTRYITNVFYQPLDQISEYFGEELAFYYCFIQFYTKSLITPSILGIILAIIQYNESNSDVVLLPIFCLFMSLYSTFIVIYWKRTNSEYSYNWGTYKYETHDEQIRPDYSGESRVNELTGELEIRYPAYKRRLKLCVTLPLLMIIAASLATLMIVLFAWRDSHVVNINTNNTSNQSLSARFNALFTANVIVVPVCWGLLIPIVDLLFTRLAVRMTTWENWKTQSLYHRHVVIKIFSFRFLNSFLPLYYYAFVNVDMTRLSLSVLSFLVAGQLFRFFMNIILPILLRRYHAYHAMKQLKQSNHNTDDIINTNDRTSLRLQQSVYLGIQHITLTHHHHDHMLSSVWLESAYPQYDNFENYADTIIQFGYITFFSCAFPLAPLLALINNLIHMRAGAYKLCNITQRPLSRKSSGIGIWLEVIQVMSIISILTNCALVGITSQQLNHYFTNLTYTNKLLITFIFEHILLILMFICKICINTTPTNVRRQLKRDKLEIEKIKTKLLELDKQHTVQMTLDEQNEIVG